MATAERYIEAIGRRKTASARVRITPGKSEDIVVNGKTLSAYFPVASHQATIMEPFTKVKVPKAFSMSVRVTGGGTASQAGAVRHAIARALIDFDITLRGELKTLGFLKRDPRAKERKKPGLVKALKRKQWSKR
jgi:small subunit ribosomal protein S9